jgi:hypothetical protein
VVLRFPGYVGKNVLVAGDFNNWEPDHNVLITRDSGDAVEKILSLQPGVYQYRLIVDGKWQDDTSNPERIPNVVGGYKSLLRVEEERETVDAREIASFDHRRAIKRPARRGWNDRGNVPIG